MRSCLWIFNCNKSKTKMV